MKHDRNRMGFFRRGANRAAPNDQCCDSCAYWSSVCHICASEYCADVDHVHKCLNLSRLSRALDGKGCTKFEAGMVMSPELGRPPNNESPTGCFDVRIRKHYLSPGGMVQVFIGSHCLHVAYDNQHTKKGGARRIVGYFAGAPAEDRMEDRIYQILRIGESPLGTGSVCVGTVIDEEGDALHVFEERVHDSYVRVPPLANSGFQESPAELLVMLCNEWHARQSGLMHPNSILSDEFTKMHYDELVRIVGETLGWWERG